MTSMSNILRSATFILTIFAICTIADAQRKRVDPTTQGYSESIEDQTKGKNLFSQYCGACHDFSRSGEIGPGLARVMYQVEKQWLIDFIKDPKAVIDSGDERTEWLMERYKTIMPSFKLPHEDIESLLAFMYINKREPRERQPESTREGAIRNPIPEAVEHSHIGLILEKYICVPARKERAPLAKINKLAGIMDGDTHRVFVNDMFGYLYEVIDNQPVLFLDLNDRFPQFITEPGLASGLNSFTFSPNFSEDGLLYTNHSEIPADKTSDFTLPETEEPRFQYVITEWKTNETHKNVLDGKGREILRIDVHGTAHCVQEITFDPNATEGDKDFGLMYIGIGDAAASYRNRPDLFDSTALPWGKILRIDPKGNNAENGQYGIPSNNPFASPTYGDQTALKEIYAYGFRNPNTISWDKSGKMLVTDIGHHNIEEVNDVVNGGDYGWPAYEGSFEADLNARQNLVFPKPTEGRKATDPLIQLDHDEMHAIAGGYVCYDENLPKLKGAHLFGDIVSGRLFMANLTNHESGTPVIPLELSLIIDGEERTISEIVEDRRADLRLGQDAQNNLYIMSKTSGCIWKVIGTQEIENPKDTAPKPRPRRERPTGAPGYF